MIRIGHLSFGFCSVYKPKVVRDQPESSPPIGGQWRPQQETAVKRPKNQDYWATERLFAKDLRASRDKNIHSELHNVAGAKELSCTAAGSDAEHNAPGCGVPMGLSHTLETEPNLGRHVAQAACSKTG